MRYIFLGSNIMKSASQKTQTLLLLFWVAALTLSAVGQKGVDTQTDKIKQDSNQVKSGRENDVGREFDWGKGKTKVRDLLPNPYRLTGRRDTIISAIVDVLKDKKIVVDEKASRSKHGIIITQPYIIAKGAVVAQNELGRYAVLPSYDSAWTRGQITYTIEIQSIDGAHNNVYINAKVEGRSGNGLTSEWTSLQSSGLAEDELMSKIIEVVTGTSPEPVQDTGH